MDDSGPIKVPLYPNIIKYWLNNTKTTKYMSKMSRNFILYINKQNWNANTQKVRIETKPNKRSDQSHIEDRTCNMGPDGIPLASFWKGCAQNPGDVSFTPKDLVGAPLGSKNLWSTLKTNPTEQKCVSRLKVIFRFTWTIWNMSCSKCDANSTWSRLAGHANMKSQILLSSRPKKSIRGLGKGVP
jgi:hypothetical protein